VDPREKIRAKKLIGGGLMGKAYRKIATPNTSRLHVAGAKKKRATVRGDNASVFGLLRFLARSLNLPWWGDPLWLQRKRIKKKKRNHFGGKGCRSDFTAGQQKLRTGGPSPQAERKGGGALR